MDRPVEVIGAPTDYGTNRRGVDMGPSAIRYAGLSEELSNVGVDVVEGGDLVVPRAEERRGVSDDSDRTARPDARHLQEVEDVSRRLSDRVADAIASDRFPLVLGGDHSIAIGTLAGSSRDSTVGAVWFDAHADFNTPETTPSGNVHGMSVAAALGRGEFADAPWAHAPGLEASNVAYVGLRSVDHGERAAIHDSDVTAFTMADIDEYGIAEVVESALAVAADGTDGVHVSLDLDWLDPREAPGVGTPIRGGATYREAHAAFEMVAERADFRSLDVVEVNPVLDRRNGTAELAVELVASAMGKRVL